MQFFVKEDSVVRKIWGKSDVVLFIFAGAAAEFALNKAVDWLYFTGKLPTDPLGRLFSTVTYARRIVFSPEEESHKAIDIIRHIHENVEQQRGAAIPDWAYRDVLYMLIHYSIASYELLEKKLKTEEKDDVYDVFYRMGMRLGLKDLPFTYNEWLPSREQHLNENLTTSKYTADLFKQYKKHLGFFRYHILIAGQKLIIPERVKMLLQFSKFSWLKPIVPCYKFSRKIKMDGLLKNILLPPEYKKQILELDVYEG